MLAVCRRSKSTWRRGVPAPAERALFLPCEAERDASDGDEFDATRDREWAAFDEVAAAPPAVTEAGRAAKARRALAMTSRDLRAATPSDGSGALDDDEVFARRVLAEVGGAALPVAAMCKHHDAEVILLAAEVVRLEREFGRLCWPTDTRDPRYCTRRTALLRWSFRQWSQHNMSHSKGWRTCARPHWPASAPRRMRCALGMATWSLIPAAWPGRRFGRW
jgi:hypothetical protein